MRVRMFKPQFAPLVKNGTKRQTIRPLPKRMPKVGDRESWREWEGKPYRSKQRELAQVELTEVRYIRITKDWEKGLFAYPTRRAIIRKDGFRSVQDMLAWFLKNHGLPFRGILIKSKDA